MKRLSVLFGAIGTLGVLSVCAATATDTTFVGRLVVDDAYDKGATCSTAADDGSICADDDIEATDDLAVGDDATIGGAATIGETLGVTGATTMSSLTTTGAVVIGGAATISGAATIDSITPSKTEIDFTVEHQVPFFAKTTGAIMTEVDTQEDYFRVGELNTYFEIFQDGDNSDCVGSWGDGLTGWVIPGADAVDQGVQLTEGIALGSAHSFTGGTDTMKMQVAFLIPTRAQLDVLQVGFRKLGAYAVGDDDTEWAAAYDDKVTVGIIDNAGVIKQMTSKATSDATTSCTHAAHTNGDILALEVAVTAAGVTSVKVGSATPAGGTTAQTQAAVTAALADLTADALCNAAAITLTAAEYVPTIEMAKTNGGASSLVLAYYYVGAE